MIRSLRKFYTKDVSLDKEGIVKFCIRIWIWIWEFLGILQHAI